MSDTEWGGYGKCPVCLEPPGARCRPALLGDPSPQTTLHLDEPHEGRELYVGPPPGPMAQAVAKDLAQIDVARVPGGYTYAQLAMWLADEIDKHAEGGPAVTAKLADQLGKAMTALTRRGDGDDDASFDRFAEEISEPVVGV